MQSAYEILGVVQTADDKEIKKAYLKLIKRFTPDHAPEQFQIIQKAYVAIKTVEQRNEYALIGVPEITIQSVIDVYIQQDTQQSDTEQEVRPSEQQMLHIFADSFKQNL